MSRPHRDLTPGPLQPGHQRHRRRPRKGRPALDQALVRRASGGPRSADRSAPPASPTAASTSSCSGPRPSPAASRRRSGSPSARRWRSAATSARASTDRRWSTPTGSPAPRPAMAARMSNAQIPFLKAYTVFNVDQVEGLPAHFYAVAEPRLDAAQRIDHADALLRGDRRRDPSRRQPGLLRPAARLCADAAVRVLRGPGGLLRDPGPRMHPLDPSSDPAGPGLRPQALGRRRLCPRGAGGRTGRGVPLRRPRAGAHAPAGSRQLHRKLAEGAEGRQAVHLHRRCACPASGRVPAPAATADLRRLSGAGASARRARPALASMSTYSGDHSRV